MIDRINTIHQVIYESVNTIYEMYTAPWIYYPNIPIGILQWVKNEYKGKELPNLSGYYSVKPTNNLEGYSIDLVKYDGDIVKCIECFINNKTGIILLIPEGLNKLTNQANIVLLQAIYDYIFTYLDKIVIRPECIRKTEVSIISMYTMIKYFDNVDIDNFTTRNISKDKLLEIGKHSVEELYGDLEILKYI